MPASNIGHGGAIAMTRAEVPGANASTQVMADVAMQCRGEPQESRRTIRSGFNRDAKSSAVDHILQLAWTALPGVA